MNDHELELFEAELRRLAPAPPPPEFLARLAAARPATSQTEATPHPAPVETGHPAPTPPASWGWLLRWLAPAAGVAVAGVLAVVFWPSAGGEGKSPGNPDQAVPALASLDDIEFDQELIASFDTIGELPGGQPVRFRCREWEDAVVLRDPARGLVIERRAPCLEVVPVGFEIY